MTARRQLLIGALAIPLSLLPFVAYASWTPQGHHLADEIRIRFDPPELPELDPRTVEELRELAPHYEGRVLPLVYHGVGSGDTAAEGDLSLSPERFGEQLAAMRAAGMSFVTASDVAAAFSGGAPLPPNAVLITFDDGRADAVLWATPLLEQAGARATMFTITSATERSGTYYASWDELESSGVWDIQSHTDDLHHLEDTAQGSLPALTSRLDGESVEGWLHRVQTDLDRADREIQQHTGRAPVAFAYPFGAWGGDRTNDPGLVFPLWQELGPRYRLGFHQDEQDEITLAGPESFSMDLRRLQVGDWSGADLIRTIAAAASRTPGVGPAAG